MIKKFLYVKWIEYKRRQFLKEIAQRGCVVSNKSAGYWKVKYEGKNLIPERCQFLSDAISIGYATTLGVNNIISGEVIIGKYCQLGADIAIHASNHPTSFLTTYINHNLFEGELKKNVQHNKIIIGNDVWIGHGAILLGNIKIGNGAIIAAGSVVTKDVENYSIVAGVPAKKIKMRFSESVISEIENLKWWDKPYSELIEMKELFFKNLEDKESIYQE
ncbi:MAG: CatB-related O-acetyltransferase [Flavobacterium sp.]|uniref:CatB-related O-acetyltransferase n=1 Tax=Flavobacterium sp. TaxID=239 RepID=UPI0022BCB7C2|nr:CatB-related O-acetyltransferase [Flavobacterium sp.]MCZ8197289.1 CatB-related O-acetyltransferase [Flavobacterium sp.]